MQQKIIIQVPMHCEKCRSKAMQTAVAMKGATSVSIDQENNRLVIIGDGVDPISLTISRRKKLSYAEIVTVEEVEIPQAQRENANVVEEPEDQLAVQWQPSYGFTLPQQFTYICYTVYDPAPPDCSNM